MLMVKRGDYGPVQIVAGRYKGRRGLYDDDDSGSGPGAVVVLCETYEEFAGLSGNAQIITCRRSSLRSIGRHGDWLRWRVVEGGKSKAKGRK
jgi:hypothetical protein